MQSCHLENCSFSEWYRKYWKFTFKSIVVPLPQEFISFLKSDSIIIPSGPTTDNFSDSESCSDQSEDDKGDFDQQTQFAPLLQKITESIALLGGCAFPKLNWSSPKDAKWITCTNTLKCVTATDVLLLLKSSDFISHDLNFAFNACVDQNTSYPTTYNFTLILREWIDVNMANEYRCFVDPQKGLLGVCQRDTANHYAFNCDPREKANVLLEINEFIMGNIGDLHRDGARFVVDLVFRDSRQLNICDFAVFGGATDSLLYEWEEFETDIEVEVRVVEKWTNSLAANEPAYSTNRIPKDLFDFAQDSSSTAEMIERFRSACVNNQI